MNQAQAAQQAPAPTTVAEIKALPNHAEARSYAAGNLLAIANLPTEGGPMASRKLFVEPKGNRVVYEFYRLNTKDIKFYIIF